MFISAKLPDGDEDIILLEIISGNGLVGVAIVMKMIKRPM